MYGTTRGHSYSEEIHQSNEANQNPLTNVAAYMYLTQPNEDSIEGPLPVEVDFDVIFNETNTCTCILP